MKKRFGFAPPYRLLIVHTALILTSMFALSQRWFLDPPPWDCVYRPFFFISGPIVYVFAHGIQHASEIFCTPEQVMICWNIVPGTVCLVLGGLQWWGIEVLLVRLFRRRRALNLQ